MKLFELLNKEYDESVIIPDTNIGESQIGEFLVKNPFGKKVKIEVLCEDPDVRVVYNPEYIEANGTGTIKLEYKPNNDRMESLIGKKVTIRTYL